MRGWGAPLPDPPPQTAWGREIGEPARCGPPRLAKTLASSASCAGGCTRGPERSSCESPFGERRAETGLIAFPAAGLPADASGAGTRSLPSTPRRIYLHPSSRIPPAGTISAPIRILLSAGRTIGRHAALDESDGRTLIPTPTARRGAGRLRVAAGAGGGPRVRHGAAPVRQPRRRAGPGAGGGAAGLSRLSHVPAGDQLSRVVLPHPGELLLRVAGASGRSRAWKGWRKRRRWCTCSCRRTTTGCTAPGATPRAR